QNQSDLLSAQAAVTRSTAEQGEIAMRQLRLRQEAERAALEQVSLANGFSAEEVRIAAERLALLRGQIHPLQERAQADATAAALSQEALNLRTAELDAQRDLLGHAASLSRSSYSRWVLGERIADLEREIERLRLEEI